MTRPRIPPESEKQFQAAVVELARVLRWTAYFVHDSRHSPAGWPDLFLLRPPRAIAAELKSTYGRVRGEQLHTLEKLQACGIEAYLWRPKDKQQIAEVLK